MCLCLIFSTIKLRDSETTERVMLQHYEKMKLCGKDCGKKQQQKLGNVFASDFDFSFISTDVEVWSECS